MQGIREDLQLYISQNILPQYYSFDKAHGMEHIRQVIDKSLSLAEKTGANREMVYVIAAYHDIGMKVSRKNHGYLSARILEADFYLKKWFSDQSCQIMSQAVEDHSTSLEKEPRSLYGKIIYHADKTLDAEDVIKRAFLFGMVYYRTYTLEQQTERVYQYVNEKYGERGQLRLWLNIPEEYTRLQELQKKIKDKNYVCDICRKYYAGEDLDEIKRSYGKNDDIKV